jgi:hypothetical protein
VTTASTLADEGRPVPPRRRVAILTGLMVAVLVLVGGWVFWQERPTEYEATSTLVILPDSANVEAASYYDTLSQGQISTTIAQILDLRAAPVEGGSDATYSVDVVPDTSLIQVSVTADDAAVAEAEADAALERVRPYFDQLTWPYDIFEVDAAEGTAEETGLEPGLLAGVVAAMALFAAGGAYLAVRAIQQARQASQPRSGQRPRDGGDDTGGLEFGPTAWSSDRDGASDEKAAPATAGRMARLTADPLPPQPAR